MNIEIKTKIEARRGCGFRKPGGIYLVGPPEGRPCCRLPWPLHICPTCGHGIKPGRGWQWIDCEKLFVQDDMWECQDDNIQHEAIQGPIYRNPCSLREPGKLGRAGLLWIGEVFYKTPEEFLAEARTMDISRRISTVPKGFELGKTWILLAHRKACVVDNDGEQDLGPGIFSVFRPNAIEYVTQGDETREELERIMGRGLIPVEVNPRRAYR